MDSPDTVRAFIPQLEAAALPRRVSVPIEKSHRHGEQTTKVVEKAPLISKSVYETPHGEITLWKINEWAFSSSAEKLPCYSRGLFIGNDRILIRGYDKFFNVGELLDHHPSQIKLKTVGPYQASVKENGCIIFFSGLPGGELLTASKRALGSTFKGKSSHADAGEAALRRQLGPDEIRQFAQYLYDEGLTVVCEFCDDKFEEHVLSYNEKEAGLYLHGVNYNSIEFKSKSVEFIKQFSHKWRFKAVQFIDFDTFDDFMDLMSKSMKTGTYDGKETEGFVVRCTKLQDGLTFFFKFKFEQPYLFYRNLRELTAEYLIKRTSIKDLKLKSKKRLDITAKYLDFIQEYFKDEERLEQWKNGVGVIAVRREFSKSIGKSGMDLLEDDGDNGVEVNEPTKPLKTERSSAARPKRSATSSKPREKSECVQSETPDNARGIIKSTEIETKYVIVSLATPGSGKTTTFRTVENLFPNFSHIQNDDLKNTQRVYSNLIRTLTSGADAVFFDKNNHQMRERETLFVEASKASQLFYPDGVDIKFICCNFQFSDVTEHRKLTFDRILKRGDNHQSISAQKDPEKALKIAGGFISRYQKLDVTHKPDSKFDLIIQLPVTASEESSLNNAKAIVKSLHELYPGLVKQIPSDVDFEKSFKEALAYKPEFRKFVDPQKEMKKERQNQEKLEKKLEEERYKKMTDAERKVADEERKKKDKIKKEMDKKKQEEAAKKQKASKMKMSWATYFGASISNHEELIETVDEYARDDPTWAHLKSVNRVQAGFHVTLMHSMSAMDEFGKSIWLLYAEKMKAISLQLDPKDPEMNWPLDFFYDIRLDELVIAENYLICFKVAILKSYYDNGECKDLPNTCSITHITVGTADESIKPFQLNAVLRHLVLHPESEFQIEKDDAATFVGSHSTKVKVIKLNNKVLVKQPLTAFRQVNSGDKAKTEIDGARKEKQRRKNDQAKEVVESSEDSVKEDDGSIVNTTDKVVEKANQNVAEGSTDA